MSAGLHALARAAGIAVHWTDLQGTKQVVPPDTLRAVLSALNYPADTSADISESLRRLQSLNTFRPLTVVAAGGKLEKRKSHCVFTAENGEAVEQQARDGFVRAPSKPGYYKCDEQSIAVVPPRAWTLNDVPGRRLWGTAAQVYALQGGTTRGFGDFAALARLARDTAALGSDAVVISPVHALFGADPSRYSPYAPSTRLFLNPLYASLDARIISQVDTAPIDWPTASTRKLAALRRRFELRTAADRDDIAKFAREGGEKLLAHARFEVLDAQFRKQGIFGWRNWPDASPHSRRARALTADNVEVAFQIFLQWYARRSLSAVQTAARNAGMAIGLIADLAVGFDRSGSHAWHAPQETLQNLSIGAPPDAFNSAGQNWGLTSLSPSGLLESGFESFILTLRTAMASSGGIRLDHAMGLQRLWVIPNGAGPGEGCYLHYPFEEMLGILMLESYRNRAIVIAEDLGTVPRGFRARIARAGFLGMSVLWFERDARGNFEPPQRWRRESAALSTTHDLPTLAGWWNGDDIAIHKRLDRSYPLQNEKWKREKDRKRLWSAFRKARCAKGRAAGASAMADAAFGFLAQTRCSLAVAPVEDFIGSRTQTNVPGTVDEYPNWRMRLKSLRPMTSAAAKRRAAILNRERSR